MKRDPLEHLRVELVALDARGLRRHRSRRCAPFSTNDYLGLARRPAPAAESGAGASRLVTGERDAHVALEEALALWIGVEACLLFSSGYAANVGALSALAGSGDLIISDSLNHASIVDGARLSRARVVVVPHNDVHAVRSALSTRSEAHAWVVVESYYSMDADGPDLHALRRVCDEHGAALYVDEAHALGVLGPGGRGLAAQVLTDIRIGTLGKAFGSQGAFVAGTTLLCEWMWNRARSFVFSTGLAPVNAVAAHQALEHIIEADDERAHILDLAAGFRAAVGPVAARAGLEVLGHGHVVPLLVGDSARAAQLSVLLDEEGVWVPPIRPPTVPEGRARLRFTLTAAHTHSEVTAAINAVVRAIDRLG